MDYNTDNTTKPVPFTGSVGDTYNIMQAIGAASGAIELNPKMSSLIRRHLYGVDLLPTIVGTMDSTAPYGYVLMSIYTIRQVTGLKTAPTRSKNPFKCLLKSSTQDYRIAGNPVIAFLICRYTETVHAIWYMENL